MVIVALIGTDGLPYQIYQDLSNGTWGWYGPLPNPNGLHFTSMAMERSSNGNGQLFLTGTDGRLYLIFFDASLDGPPIWYGQLPSPSGCPYHCLVALAAGQGSGLQVVGIEEDYGAPSTEVWGDYLAGSTWVGYGPFGDTRYTFRKIATVVCSDCGGWPALYAIGLRPNSGLVDPPTLGLPCVSRQLVFGTGDWGSFPCQDNPDGVKFQAMATGRGNNDNPQLIMIGANPNCSDCDGKPYLYFQQNSTGAWPLAWYGPLPNPDSMKFHFVTTGNGNNGGNMQVIALAGPAAGLPYLIYQGRGDGSWHWYGPLPDPIGMQFTTASAAQGNNNNLQVVLLGTDGRPYLIWQGNSDGQWHWYGLLPTG